MDKDEKRIEEFKARFEVDGREFCEELFRHATIRLLAFKYAYYVESEEIVKDMTYDLEEKSWFIMGRALGHLQEDEISPCVDFDSNHPLAPEAIVLATRFMKK